MSTRFEETATITPHGEILHKLWELLFNGETTFDLPVGGKTVPARVAIPVHVSYLEQIDIDKEGLVIGGGMLRIPCPLAVALDDGEPYEVAPQTKIRFPRGVTLPSRSLDQADNCVVWVWDERRERPVVLRTGWFRPDVKLGAVRLYSDRLEVHVHVPLLAGKLVLGHTEFFTRQAANAAGVET